MPETPPHLDVIGAQPLPAEAVTAFRRFAARLQPVMDHQRQLLVAHPVMPAANLEQDFRHAE